MGSEERILRMPLGLFPAVGYFAAMARYDAMLINRDERFDKRQKRVHRYDIADTRGELALTVPITRPSANEIDRPLRWSDVKVSTHGDWWHTHRITLESAYGRTPFFEFYVDRLARFFSPETPEIFASVADMAIESVKEAAKILGLNTRIITSAEELSGGEIVEQGETEAIKEWVERERYQIRADKLGFIQGLSVLDLIFNMGTESPLYLV